MGDLLPDWTETEGLAGAFRKPEGVVYLDGHSLGLATHRAVAKVRQVVGDWERLGVDGWNEADPRWFTWCETLAAQVAPLVGARPEEVAVTGTLTGNLHQLLATLWRPRGGRRRILVDALAFPSDRYAVQGFLRLMGSDPATDLAEVSCPDGEGPSDAALEAALADPTVAVAVLPGVVYTNGLRLDLARWSAFARDHGVILIWDLAHAVGAVPVNLGAARADAAVWCHYKHLHGGPGCPGGLFLASRHDALPAGLPGWWGADPARRFSQAPEFPAARGAARLQVGTPPILSLAALAGALDVVGSIDPARVRARAWRLIGRLREAFAALGGDWQIVSPSVESRAGGHLAVTHPRAREALASLRARGVLGDFRGPNLVRFAPSGLATTDAEIDRACEAIAALRDLQTSGEFALRGLVP